MNIIFLALFLFKSGVVFKREFYREIKSFREERICPILLILKIYLLWFRIITCSECACWFTFSSFISMGEFSFRSPQSSFHPRSTEQPFFQVSSAGRMKHYSILPNSPTFNPISTQQKKEPDHIRSNSLSLNCGLSWARTSDRLIMSFKLGFLYVYTDLYLLVLV